MSKTDTSRDVSYLGGNSKDGFRVYELTNAPFKALNVKGSVQRNRKLMQALTQSDTNFSTIIHSRKSEFLPLSQF